MYNLLVSFDSDAWNGEPCILELGRCVREYTDEIITEKYGDFTDAQIEKIRRFPCIFAYETGIDKDPKFGLITNITNRQEKVRIEYKIIELNNFLKYSDIPNMLFELDILKTEMYRTHWAIKDVNLSKELSTKNIILPNWVRSDSKAVDITNHSFDVALSFPGEVREYIKPLVTELERVIGPNSYFYDKNFVAQLARPSLDTLLQDIYGNRSKLVVVFLCEKYQEKEWCGIEFRAIREIILKRQHEKVMFVKMDNGEVEGVFDTDGYIDFKEHTPSEIASFIHERLLLLTE